MQQLNMLEPLSGQIKESNGNGNTRLVGSGIQNEQSDYRIHVSYLTQHIYVFPTQAGVKAIETARSSGVPTKTATQPGVSIVTAVGYVIPISHINGLIEVLIPYDLFKKHYVDRKTPTDYKGRKALMLVVDMLKRNLVPLPLQISIINDEDLQIKGYDIIIRSKLHIQVKCDYNGGSKKHSPKATGNLFLQIAECNPKKLY